MSRIQHIFDRVAESKFARRGVILGLYLMLVGAFLLAPFFKDYLFPPKALYVYAFMDMFHPESVAKFERQYGVKVVLRYFESNEELFAKFKINGGIGYDVINSSDYMVEHLLKENLLLALDRSKIPTIQKIDPRLLAKNYDPNNEFTVPFSWIPYGIIFHKDIFSQQPAEIGLHLLFKDPMLRADGVTMPYRICMTDDSREAIFLANLYLFGDVSSWGPERLVQAESLLIKQKDWVESYVNQDLAYQLLSGLIKVAFAPLFAVDKVLKQSKEFVFMIPKEGSLYAIENLAIPKLSKQVELAHKFINFMIGRDESARMSNHYGMNPANKEAYALLRPEVTQNKHTFPDDECFARLHLTPNDIPLKAFEEIWLAVKSF